MKRLVCLAVILSGPAFADPLPKVAETPFAPFLLAQSFTCGKTCGQMRSCEEACHALLVCNDRARDRDNDGIPCESLCSRPC